MASRTGHQLAVYFGLADEDEQDERERLAQPRPPPARLVMGAAVGGTVAGVLAYAISDSGSTGALFFGVGMALFFLAAARPPT